MTLRVPFSRVLLSAALGGLCLLLCKPSTTAAPLALVDEAPAPRPAAAVDLDRKIIAEIKERSEIMKNLQYISDIIGPRLTGSKSAEKANKWTADKMKAYGLENVRLEPWEIPVGWERGKASMKLLSPGDGRTLTVASRAWAPGTKGKITGDVVVIKAKNKADLQVYKGKLKNTVVLISAPANVKPVQDPVGPGDRFGPPKKDEPKKDEPKKDPPADVSVGSWLHGEEQPGGFGFATEIIAFAREEGAACVASDSAKPHGLVVTGGNWGRGDRVTAQEGMAQVFLAHEHYSLLYRLATTEKEAPRVEVEVENKFVDGPVTVYNTVGEVRGSDKPDEIVVVGAHLDSWDLASGTTDNGTGSCIVLETARTVAIMAKNGQRPKRTIRFVLFTGEEQGLWGSRKYVEKYKDDMDKHSVALVHDTGTGKVVGFGLQGRKNLMPVLEPQLETLKTLEGWKGLDTGNLTGTDHQSFERVGVPGFACRQDMEGYRLTHHTQSDTFDKAKEANLIQGAQVMSVTAVRIANMPELLPRK